MYTFLHWYYTELGTRQHLRDKVTMFSDPNIMSIFVVDTLIFCIFACHYDSVTYGIRVVVGAKQKKFSECLGSSEFITNSFFLFLASSAWLRYQLIYISLPLLAVIITNFSPDSCWIDLSSSLSLTPSPLSLSSPAGARFGLE